MFDWLTSIVGQYAAPIAVYILIFVLLLIGFFIVRAVLRRMRGGTFVNGGHGRKQRLAIIDATPVDNRRRLVLVRRDNVEHLVLIGGMNDLVVERDIELQSAPKVELATSLPESKLQQDKVSPSSELAKPIPPFTPEPKQVVAEPKPLPTPTVPTPKVEPPTPLQPSTEPSPPPIEPIPVTKNIETKAVPNAAAALTGLASAQLSPELERSDTEAARSAQAESSTSVDPTVGRFSAYAEHESKESEAVVQVPETTRPSDDSIDEFMPINAPAPTTESADSPSPTEESEVKEDESDLEDEMEQLLNKLTRPSTL